MGLGKRTFTDLKTLNGMNTSKQTGLILILVGVLMLCLSDDSQDRLYILGLISCVIGGLWVLYASALALSVISDKGGLPRYVQWEWKNLKDTLLATNIKMFVQFLLVFGLGLIFISYDLEKEIELSKRKSVRILGYVCVGLAVPYALALMVITYKLS